MKNLKRWLAFFMAVLLLVGIAFNSQNPLIASQTDQNTTDTSVSSNETGSQAEGVTVQEAASSESGTDTVSAESASDTQAAGTASPLSLNFENDDVTVTVTAASEGIIPAGATLKVVPIVADSQGTKGQYDQVAQKVEEKTAASGNSVLGFLAYDITFADSEGKEVEPNGEVSVSIQYKQAALPQNVSESDSSSADVTVLHLEEDTSGQVQNVVDLKDSNQLSNVQTTDGQKVQSAEFQADSFSVYTITWKAHHDEEANNTKVQFHYVTYNSTTNQYEPIVSTEFTDYSITYSGSNSSYIPLAIKHFSGYKYASNYITYESDDYWNPTETVYDIVALSYSNGRDDRGLSYYTKNDLNYGSYIGEELVDVYFIYDTYTAPGSGGTADPLDAPSQSKKIAANSDGTYSLTLDVTGKKQTEAGVDVLLVLDCSGSMGDYVIDSNGRYITDSRGNYVTRIGLMKTEVEKLSGAVLGTTGTSALNRVAVVSFSSDRYSGGRTFVDWTGTNSDVTSGLESSTTGLTADGATNWQSAMIKADAALAERSTSKNEKYVIFISDGKPTVRYQSYTAINNNSYGGEIGAGGSDDGRNYDAAVAQFELSTYLRNTKMYAMYLTSDTQVAMQNFASAVGATEADGTGTNFDTTMNTIASKIIYNAYKNVSITDTISEYAELVDGSSAGFTVKKNGTVMTSGYTLTISGKTFTVAFSGELEQGAVYSVSCKIKPSDLAYYQYSTAGYSNTGDVGTDADGNNTSSEKSGFNSDNYASRTDGKAIVSYEEVVGSTGVQTSPYKHPVIQVSLDTVSHTVKKIWNGPSISGLTVTLVPTITENGTARDLTSDEIAAYSAFSGITWTKTLDSTTNQASWDSLPQYYYYKNGDTVVKDTITYTAKENLTAEQAAQYESSTVNNDSSTVTTITNKKLSELTVSKVWSDGTAGHTADTIYVGLYKGTTSVSGKYAVLNDSSWTAVFKFVGTVSDYTVKELRQTKTGETPDFTINNTGYIGIDTGTVGTVGSKKYQVSYAVQSSDTDTYKATETITNRLILNNVVITKKDAANADTLLSGAVFKLKKLNSDGTTYTYIQKDGKDVTATTDQNGKAVFTDLADGKYYAEEVTAPDGYTLLKDPVEILVSSTGKTEQLDTATNTYYFETDAAISNTKIYKLPDSGGIGTYLFTISGVAILMTALLLFILNKRKEDRKLSN